MADYHKKILFLGNSYIYVNELPMVLSNLALSGGYDLHAEHITRGGARLEEFICEENELCSSFNQKLKENNWDFVVLQEQSQIPAIPEERQSEMYPSIRLLNNKIKSSGAETILFMTWGRHFGDPENGYKDFESMQEALKEGYTNIGDEISSLVVPAGIAWLKGKQREKDIELWDEDGSHPSIMGTYLTACVFYASLLKQSPVGLSYTAGLPKERAEFLQEIALESIN
jgi:hypothetical protein